MRARALVIVAALVLTTLVAVPTSPAAADTPGPAVFGTETFTAFVGDRGGTPGVVNCPAGSVLTAVTVAFRGRDSVVSARARCSPALVENGKVALGEESASGAIGGPAGGVEQTSSCPTGDVVIGVHVGPLSGPTGASGQVRCRTLQRDGTLAADETLGTVIGRLDTNPPADPRPSPNDRACPRGSVATGIAGAATTDYDKPTLTSFALRCQSLGFPSVTPVDINVTWPTALTVGASSTTSGTLTAPGQDRWYRFPVQPGARVSVDLTGLSADYDLTLFKDIEQAFTTLTSTADLTKLSAEFAGDAYSPSVFSPSVFSPSVFSPSVFSPSVFSPSVFSPSVFSPSVFSPSVFSPSVFSPSVFSPSVFSPSVFSPAVSLPSVFSPSVFSPSVFSPSVFSEAFSSAQTRSLIGFSSRDGTAPENVTSSTWNNTGYFYARVQGRNGTSSDDAYSFQVTSTGGTCTSGLDTHADDGTLTGSPGAAETVILTDPARLPGTAAQKSALASQLTAFAGRVGGTVVDLGQSQRVRALNAQADDPDFISCPYAKNLVAQAARDIVNSYRDPAGTLKYVVVVGDDAVVPFFRYPDTAGLGPESSYVPPVANQTASEASLRGNYVLSQDAYGSAADLSIKGTSLPVPDLSVGRLVESPSEISSTLQAYLARNGAPLTPGSSLTTGYDFLTDAADAVAEDFAAGIPGGRHDTLITDRDVPPEQTTQGGTPSRRRSWTATDLRQQLFGARHDLVYLAGHFSANNTLAADYDTTVRTQELAAAPAGIFNDTLVLSAGCHSGYTIVDADGVPQVTDGLDWTEAFAQRGATLIAGTGYQYGDTDFLEYSERLYADLAHQLRLGTGAVPIGNALVRAKQNYLRDTPTLAGIDQKSVLEATLYGLPMLGVDLPAGGRVAADPDDSLATPTEVSSGPGEELGLQSDDVSLDPELRTVTQPLTNTEGGSVTATYLTGPDGVSTGPAEPALPLVNANVTAPGQVLRGVALRSATYTDTNGITPLTGAPATETHSVHTPFVTPAFYPGRIATPNYYDAVGGSQSTGTTRLMVTPAQHRSDAAGSLTDTLRRYSALGLRLFYSNNTQTYGATPTYEGNVPALSAPPTLTGIEATVQGATVTFRARVVGNPAAGIQSAWVTYTGQPGSPFHGRWQSLDLTQSPADSTLWTGTLTLPAGQDASDLRYLDQAVNGVGLVGVDDNQGSYFTPGVTVGEENDEAAATELTWSSPAPTSGDYGDTVTVRARLTDDATGTGLAQRPVTFAIGGTSQTGFTDATGTATAAVPLSVVPGNYALLASYDGDATTAPASTAPSDFAVGKQATRLSLSAASSGSAPGDRTITATLLARAGLPLREKTVYLAITDAAGRVVDGQTAITDRQGRADFDLTGLPPTATTVQAFFGSNATPVPGGGTVDLSDLSFAASGPVTATVASPVVAAADAYTTREGTKLTVAKPGVLGNDTAGATAVLIAPPSSGTLALKPDGSFTYTPAAELVGQTTFTYQAVKGGVSSTPAAVTLTVTEVRPPGCTITGTAGNDVLNGTARNDVICGLGGNDTITGGDGNDRLFGGSGDDIVNGGNGNDVLEGRGGADRLSGGNGIDGLSGGTGNDTLSGDAGADLLGGGAGNDSLSGGTGNDALGGDAGNDTLSGGDSEDALVGGLGVDRLSGDGAGDYLDVRDGAAGDRADGGPGRDICVRDAGDVVTNVP